MNRMISYYELLGMIKDDNIPKKIKLHMCGTTRIYVADYEDEDFSNYCLENINDESDDFRCYLAECFLESDMFEENIEITEEDKKIEKIVKLNNVGNAKDLGEFEDKQQLNNHILKDKINELIDEINKIKESAKDER